MSVQRFFLLALLAMAHSVRSEKCSFIAILMDESGSMGGEQVFLRESAMPEVIEDLRLRLERRVFVCSYGFPGSAASEAARVIGCSSGYDLADYAFRTTADGTREDGWAAIQFADQHSRDQTAIDGVTIAECESVSTVYSQ